jgi:hypothetical protein
MNLILIDFKTSEFERVHFFLRKLVQIVFFANDVNIGESHIKVDFFVLKDT